MSSKNKFHKEETDTYWQLHTNIDKIRTKLCFSKANLKNEVQLATTSISTPTVEFKLHYQCIFESEC